MTVIDYIQEFLAVYSGMQLGIPSGDDFVLTGQFGFSVHDALNNIHLENEIVNLRIEVPFDYPDEVPKIYEEAGGELVPRDMSYHKYQNGQFCLGSPLELRAIIAENASLLFFVENTIVPFIVAAKHKGAGLNNGAFIYGELKHGEEGLIEDFERRFQLKLDMEQIIEFFDLLGKKKRIANKLPCSCGNGKIVRKCSCHSVFTRARNAPLYSRPMYRALACDYRALQVKKRNSQRG